MNRIQNTTIILIVFMAFSVIRSQTISQNTFILKDGGERFDKCNFDSTRAAELYELLGDGWGYNYDSLMIDLDKWRESPFVVIDSIGASVQDRALWQLTISDSLVSIDTKYRITIHARTHPNEIYSFYATRAIINQLIGNSELAKRFRNYAIFNIVPIYNPDGVELGYPRENANGVDLERDWDSENPQPESAALKALYLGYMNSQLPINIALNMHNDGGAGFRYFVYHHENGTSVDYTVIEREFIGAVHSYWPDGIDDWDAAGTWTTGTPTYYPESWFWLNYHESVLALTFEEITTGTEPDFVRTADALLNGIADFVGLEELTNIKDTESITLNNYLLHQNYPNPFNPVTSINWQLAISYQVELTVYDVLGAKVASLVSERMNPGNHSYTFDASHLPSGVYFYRLQVGEFQDVKKMILLR